MTQPPTGPAPETRRDDTVDLLHGVEVPDPYRWLEDADSPETAAWVQEQNRHSRAHLDALASRPWFADTMRRIAGMPRSGTPEKLGERYVVSRNDGTHEQPVWFVADSLDELRQGGRVLLDPNTFSADGTASLAGYDASRDGRWLAYQVSEGGSDWSTVRVLDLDTAADLPDEVLTKVKFSGATWLPDHTSFLYLHFAVPGEAVGTDTGELPGGRLRLHRLGTAQEDDPVVWEAPEDPRLAVAPTVSHDGAWLAVNVFEGTSEKNRLWMYPLRTVDGVSEVGEPLRVVDDATAAVHFVRADGDRVVVRTDLEAPLGRVVSLDLGDFPDTGRADVTEVLAQTDDALVHVEAVGAELLALHLVDAAPRLTRYAFDPSGGPVDAVGIGEVEVEVEGGSLVAVHGDVGDDEVFLGLSSLTSPLTAYRLDLSDGALTALPDLTPTGTDPWQPPETVIQRRRAVSGDGTEVPYFLVRPAGVADDEPRPTLLYGYGGFDVPIAADFRATFAGWLAAGGTLAIANLRGGGEFGSAWHDAGRLQRKENVFDDFAAVADRLVADGVATHDRLALHGGSNGGLLVGAVLTRRPDLAAVALPAVGVLDMLRFHLFTIGGAWVTDYGSPDDPELFAVLHGYSPLHRVEPGTAYPATLVLTGDHDDRVVPAHSFKFTAALQHAQAGPAPVLARIETSTGHGLGKPVSVVAAESADLLAFAAEHTGLVPGPATHAG